MKFSQLNHPNFHLKILLEVRKLIQKFAVILTENTTIIVKAIKFFLSLEFTANEMTGTNTWLKTVTIDL